MPLLYFDLVMISQWPIRLPIQLSSFSFFTIGVLAIDDDRKIEDLHDLEVAFLAWQVYIQLQIVYRSHLTPCGN